MPNFDLEKKHQKYVIGVDEVGYGAWAGPLVVCACAINIEAIDYDLLTQIKDSKMLTKIKREKISQQIIEENSKNNLYCWWEIGMIDAHEIDKINILQANMQLMKKVIYKLGKKIKISHILIDGNKIPSNLLYPVSSILKGDKKSYTIAISSILAKVYRDNFMADVHKQYSEYGWNSNVGYGTKKHRDGIEKYGITKLHRLSYKPIKKYANLI